jgi:hypothetical protein
MHLRILHNENDVPAQQASPPLRNLIQSQAPDERENPSLGAMRHPCSSNNLFSGMNNDRAIDPLPPQEDLRLKASF